MLLYPSATQPHSRCQLSSELRRNCFQIRYDAVTGFTAVIMCIKTALAQKAVIVDHAVCCPDDFTAVIACDAVVSNTIITEQLFIYICAFILCKFHAAVITNSYFFHFKFLQKQKIPIRRKVTLSEL